MKRLQWEHYGDRCRIILGDQRIEDEGNPFVGLSADWRVECGEFDASPTGPAEYRSQSLLVCVIHWGIYIAIRGKRIR
jgi:hypothetical protein